MFCRKIAFLWRESGLKCRILLKQGDILDFCIINLYMIWWSNTWFLLAFYFRYYEDYDTLFFFSKEFTYGHGYDIFRFLENMHVSHTSTVDIWSKGFHLLHYNLIIMQPQAVEKWLFVGLFATFSVKYKIRSC